MNHSITTIINYCSNEFRFLESCIKEAEKFSNQVLITVCDHFFDATKERKEELNYVFNKFPSCKFLYYPYFLSEVPKKILKRLGDNFCCTFSRLLGWSYLPEETEYVLFLDADEIVESSKFLTFLDKFNYRKYAAIKFANYWYFRECKYQAKALEDSCVLANKKALSRKALLQEGDRFAAFRNAKGSKISMVKGLDNLPFIHHYSWVRTKEEMLKKVTAWGHRNERDWKKLVEEEFSKEFSGVDFVHGYDFEEVSPLHEIDLLCEPQKSDDKNFKNVQKISLSEINKILGKGIYSFFPLVPPLKRLD